MVCICTHLDNYDKSVFISLPSDLRSLLLTEAINARTLRDHHVDMFVDENTVELNLAGSGTINNTCIGDEAIKRLYQRCGGIRTLILNRCHAIGKESLYPLFQNNWVPYLSWIELSRCRKIDDSIVDLIAQNYGKQLKVDVANYKILMQISTGIRTESMFIGD